MKSVIKVALIALLWIVAVNPGKISVDTAARLRMAHALWTGTEEVVIPPGDRPLTRGGYNSVLGVGGKRYYEYDMGQSLLMVPGDWIATQFYKLLPKLSLKFLTGLIVNFLIFIPLNVAAVVSCFWLLRLFDFSKRIAGLGSITLLLGTTVLHYAQINQQNNQLLLFVTLGYATALAYLRSHQPRLVLFSGLALGAAFLIRITSAIYGITVLLFLLGGLIYQRHDKLKLIKLVGLWGIGFIPFVLMGRVFCYLRFGSFWATGYGLWMQQLNKDPLYLNLPTMPANFPEQNPAYVGIWGVLFSPAKSIFIYDPLLLPCLLIGVSCWKRLTTYLKLYLIAAVFNLLFFLALTSRYDFWHGDAAWGSRYHVTSVHLLLIPLIGLFIEQLLTVKGLKRWLLRSLLALAITVQIASVILHPTADTGRTYLAQPQSFFKFRLGWRLSNINCVIAASPSPSCPSELKATLLRKINLLPFTFTESRGIFFIIWGLMLMAAIVTTIYFVYG